jgi:hypothetical protein
MPACFGMRCPTGECTPASRWIGASRLHTLIPRTSLRWKRLYRLRGAVERENGRLKNEWALLPLRVRRIERVQLHADLTIPARLAVALDKARGCRWPHSGPSTTGGAFDRQVHRALGTACQNWHRGLPWPTWRGRGLSVPTAPSIVMLTRPRGHTNRIHGEFRRSFRRSLLAG